MTTMKQPSPLDYIELVPAERKSRELRREQSAYPKLWQIMDQVKDPEIPALSIWDMGILQNIHKEGEMVVITITPTYSGCPAMDIIKEDIQLALSQASYLQSKVLTQLSPAWTTDWMTADAQQRLREFGIAAPNDVSGGCMARSVQDLEVKCPRCGSKETELLSEFGSTACKALLKCRSCHEPFDYFKRI